MEGEGLGSASKDKSAEEKAALVEAGKNTRFGQPNGNKPGMTSARAKLMIEAAEKAARIQDKLLTVLESQLDDVLLALNDPTDIGTLNELVGQINKPTTISLIKMVQDRELGTPRQSIDLTSDGSFAPPTINIGFVPGVTPIVSDTEPDEPTDRT